MPAGWEHAGAAGGGPRGRRAARLAELAAVVGGQRGEGALGLKVRVVHVHARRQLMHLGRHAHDPHRLPALALPPDGTG